MKRIITAITVLLIALGIQAQTSYEIVQVDSMYTIKVSTELSNGQISVTYTPSNRLLDSAEVNNELFQIVNNSYGYAATAASRNFDYTLQGRAIVQLLNSRDTSYYDYTDSNYAPNLDGRRAVLVVDGQRYTGSLLVNGAGRLILQTDTGNARLRIESDRSFTLINSPDVGANAYLFFQNTNGRANRYRGSSDNGANVALIIR